MPDVELMPVGVASPWAAVAASRSPRVAPGSTKARLRFGVYADALHLREIDHQGVVPDRLAGDVVAGAAHGDEQSVLAGELHGRDNVGSGRALGDQRWLELLREHNAIIREQVRAYQGYEVKTEGDGFMLAFSSVRRAVECAMAIQRGIADRNASADEKIEVRAGLHTGEVIQDAGDFYGKHVNLAARIADEAKGGEILVSSLLKELTESGGDINFSDSRDVELKDLGRQQVFAVNW